MRSAVDRILKFNSGFHRPSLALKRERMSSSCFAFFRGTFHLFAFDILEGPFRNFPSTKSAGPIVGDLHTENFGTFRAVSGDLVYDINDFDETTSAPYEFDLRRMSSSLLLAALDTAHTFSQGVSLAETYLRAYLDSLARHARLASRDAFLHLHDHRDVRETLALASERSRIEFLKSFAEPAAANNSFHLRPRPGHLAPAPPSAARAARRALPEYLSSCVAPSPAAARRMRLQDIAFRFAGCGSLGRRRYALLLDKGRDPVSWEDLRFIEWKDSLDSSLESPAPRSSKARARDVVRRTADFQLIPKRYLGHTLLDSRQMQARELGANDARFPHREFTDIERFQKAARIFGEITARAHLLATLGKSGPRSLTAEIRGAEDRFVHRLLAFAAAYAGRAMDDFYEFHHRLGEVERAWRPKSSR